MAAILGIFMNHNNIDGTSELYGYMITCVFSFPLALAVDVFMESKKIGRMGQFLGSVMVLILIGAAYFYVFKNLQANFGIDWLRSFLMFLAATALVFFAPFFCSGKANAFWQFSIALIVRIFQAFIYFGIFYLGIVLLLYSVNYLFQFRIDSEYYGDAWILITGGFASMFFLAGVPLNYKSLDQTTTYPKFLRVLAEYFLVPLVLLFFLVLYAYSAKIVFNWEQPMGGVAAWVTGFSTVGLITYFFLYSLKDKFLGYVEFFKKWFFVALLPLLVVLALSIWVRIQDYGVTQDRYFVAAFGVWALILAAFYLISRSKNLKFMAVSFFVIVVAILYGPQSVFELPKTSQMARLEKVLVDDGILVNGKVIKVDASKLSAGEAYNINSILSYIVQNYGTDSLQPWFNENLSEIKIAYAYDYWTKVTVIQGYMGIDIGTLGAQPMGNSGDNKYFTAKTSACQTDYNKPYRVSCGTEVGGYRYYFSAGVDSYLGSQPTHIFAGDQEYVAELNDGKIFNLKNVKTGEVLFAFEVQSFFDNLLKKYPNTNEVNSENMSVQFSSAIIRISTLNATYDKEKIKSVDSISFDLLLK